MNGFVLEISTPSVGQTDRILIKRVVDSFGNKGTFFSVSFFGTKKETEKNVPLFRLMPGVKIKAWEKPVIETYKGTLIELAFCTFQYKCN